MSDPKKNHQAEKTAGGKPSGKQTQENAGATLEDLRRYESEATNALLKATARRGEPLVLASEFHRKELEAEIARLKDVLELVHTAINASESEEQKDEDRAARRRSDWIAILGLIVAILSILAPPLFKRLGLGS